MAMIKCPNCGQEISDKAKKCIHCEKIFEEGIEETKKNVCSECGAELGLGATVCDKCGCPVQNEEERKTHTENKNKEKNKKKFIIAGITVICAVIAIVVGINVNKSNQAKKIYNEYIDTLQLAEATMLEGASQAEELTDLTARVWKNAIYEEEDSVTDKYVYPGGKVVDDFNTALLLLYIDDNTIIKTDNISANQETVKGYIKRLQDVPHGLEKCYDTINNLYDAYGILTDLAINPSGSYNSFIESANTAVSDFKTAYKKLDSQIPDKK